MKHILPLALALCLATGASAQSKLDASARLLLNQAKAAATPAARSGEIINIPSADPNLRNNYIITYAGANISDALAAKGYQVISSIDDMAVISLNAFELAELAELPDIKSISLGYPERPLLDSARAISGVDDAHAGTGLDHPYTGKGVAVGMMDGGLDVNHVAFTDADGNSRIKRLWVITGAEYASVQTFDTPEKIADFNTDDSDDTHATHVLGIITGSYTGKGRAAYINPRTGRLATASNRDIPYKGVAPEATIIPSIGTFHNNNSTTAAGLISDYAAELGMPAVMNLSLGHNYGPHDGTTSQNKLLAKYGEKMLICISAGNEGDEPVSYHKAFTASDNSVKTCVANSASATLLVDIWGGDATPFTVSLLGVEKATGAIKYSYKFSKSTTLTGAGYNNPDYVNDTKFDPIFGERGYVIADLGVNADNNRYNAYVTINLQQGASGAGIVPAIMVEGSAGKSVDIYTPSGMSSLGLAGFVNGNADGSINGMACGDNIICVGAYIDQVKFPTFSQIVDYSSRLAEGDIASFSSYGTLINGKQLPDITAPGFEIISSVSTPYMNKNTSAQRAATAEYKGASRSSWWAAMSGTSMSAPFVTGTLALWLQADPTLTVAEVKDILKETSVRDEFTAAAPHRFGYGKINALEGLKKILNMGAVTSVKTDNDFIITGSGTYDIFAAGASRIDATIFNISGAAALQGAADGDNLTLDASSLAPGVYILRATADGSRTATRKIVI